MKFFNFFSLKIPDFLGILGLLQLCLGFICISSWSHPIEGIRSESLEKLYQSYFQDSLQRLSFEKSVDLLAHPARLLPIFKTHPRKPSTNLDSPLLSQLLLDHLPFVATVLLPDQRTLSLDLFSSQHFRWYEPFFPLFPSEELPVERVSLEFISYESFSSAGSKPENRAQGWLKIDPPDEIQSLSTLTWVGQADTDVLLPVMAPRTFETFLRASHVSEEGQESSSFPQDTGWIWGQMDSRDQVVFSEENLPIFYFKEDLQVLHAEDLELLETPETLFFFIPQVPVGGHTVLLATALGDQDHTSLPISIEAPVFSKTATFLNLSERKHYQIQGQIYSRSRKDRLQFSNFFFKNVTPDGFDDLSQETEISKTGVFKTGVDAVGSYPILLDVFRKASALGDSLLGPVTRVFRYEISQLETQKTLELPFLEASELDSWGLKNKEDHLVYHNWNSEVSQNPDQYLYVKTDLLEIPPLPQRPESAYTLASSPEGGSAELLSMENNPLTNKSPESLQVIDSTVQLSRTRLQQSESPNDLGSFLNFHHPDVIRIRIPHPSAPKEPPKLF